MAPAFPAITFGVSVPLWEYALIPAPLPTLEVEIKKVGEIFFEQSA